MGAQALRSARSSAARASAAWLTQRSDTVPQARCGLSREQAASALSGLDMPRR